MSLEVVVLLSKVLVRALDFKNKDDRVRVSLNLLLLLNDDNDDDNNNGILNYLDIADEGLWKLLVVVASLGFLRI